MIMKKHTGLVLVALAGLAVGVAVHTHKRHLAPSSGSLSGSTTATALQAAQPEQAAQGVGAQVADLHAQARGQRVVSSTLHQALPALDHYVADWRTYRPQKITIAPYPDTPMDFEMVSVREEHGRTIWNGRNALTGAFLVTAATANGLHAVLDVPMADCFEMSIQGNNVSVVQTTSSGNCSSDRFRLNRKAASGNRHSGQPVSEDETKVSPKAASSSVLVDVLFFYDAATLTEAGSAEQLETAIIARVDAGNLALDNSLVDAFQWRYLGAYQIPSYTPSTKIDDDLDRITVYSQSEINIPDDTQRDFVKSKMAARSADQAVLYITGTRVDSDMTVGLAWSADDVENVVDAGTARAVVMWKRTSDNQVFDYKVTIHELAHNFSCQHDRETDARSDDNPDGAFDGDGKYWYGHKFTRNNITYGTIMSYVNGVNDQRIAYFSNPSVLFQTLATGLPVTNPRAAFNAKVLTDNAEAISKLSDDNTSSSSSSSSSGSSGGGGAPPPPSSSSSSSSSGANPPIDYPAPPPTQGGAQNGGGGALPAWLVSALGAMLLARGCRHLRRS